MGLGAVLAAVALGGCGGASPSASPGDIKISAYAFSPATLTVSPGQRVRVVNRDQVAHDVMSVPAGAFQLEPPIAGGKDGTFTAPTAPGSYPYMCTIHPDMRGTLTVR